MSIKRIASIVNVSPATVSRVLNNPEYKCSDPNVRDAIWKVAMELNYVPNDAARKLRKKIKTNKHAHYINILLTRVDRTRTDPFFTELLQVIESELHDNMCILSNIWYLPLFSGDIGYQNNDINATLSQMREDMNSPHDGLIIIGKCNPLILNQLCKIYKSVISVNRNSTNYQVDEIICDGEKIASIATAYLIHLGHKKISYIGECKNEARYQGFRSTLKGNNIQWEESYTIPCKQTEKAGYQAMEYFLKSKIYPSGIYCANDITAIGMLKCLVNYKLPYYVPSIISSDGILQAQFSTPMLTTVELPKKEMGKFAVQLLMDRLNGGHTNIVRMEIEGTLKIRNSCLPYDNTICPETNN